MRILISCFEPFGNNPTNSSLEVVKEINSFDNVEIKKVTVPVTYVDSFRVIKDRIETFKPDYIILTGQAEVRSRVCLELYGYNFVSCKKPDNNNQIILNQKIINSSIISIPTQFNLQNIVKKINSPHVIVSENAGGFVCNFLYFNTLHTFQVPCVFIHYPLVKDETNNGLPLDEMVNITKKVIASIEE